MRVYMRRSTFSARSQHWGRLSVGPPQSAFLDPQRVKLHDPKGHRPQISVVDLPALYFIFCGWIFHLSHPHACRAHAVFSMLVCERIYRSRDTHLTREFRNSYSFWDS